MVEANHPHAGIGQGQILEFPQGGKFDVNVIALFGVAARFDEHVAGHVHADHFVGGTDFPAVRKQSKPTTLSKSSTVHPGCNSLVFWKLALWMMVGLAAANGEWFLKR